MSVIIKSGKKNWSGKEFSNLPAKIYKDFDDVISALNSYHFYEYDKDKGEYLETVKTQKLEIIHLSDKKLEYLVKAGLARL